MNRFTILIGLLLATADANGQDVHFASVQDVNLWYNTALKTNLLPQVHVNIRSVNYQGIIAYTSKAATIDLPLVSSTKKDGDVTGFANITAGINADNATNGNMKVSTALMTFSYALPLNADETYLAAGFQGTYIFNQVGSSSFSQFPVTFDKYGAFGSALSADPLLSGYQYGYFTVGTGASLFHNGEKRQWYIGASIRNFNQPYTEWTRSTRLSKNVGIQAGYATALANEDALSTYGIFNWHGGTHERLIGALYTRNLDDSAKNSFLLGAGYRFRDALIPNVGLKFGANRIGFYYEFNFLSSSSDNYNRKAFEFSYMLNL